MIKIKSIKIGGFRNIKTTQLKLQDLIVLVGRNNLGKSNIIAAIQFAFDFINSSSKKRNHMMRWIKGIPLTPALSDSLFSFDVELENDTLTKHRYINYGFSFSWYNDRDKDGYITNEWIHTREKTSVKYTSYLKRNEEKYRQSKDTSSFKTIKLDSKILAIDLLELFIDEEISQIATIIKGFQISICDSLDARNSFHRAPIALNDIEANQIPKILYDLKQKDLERYEDLMECIFDIFPEFQEINVDYVKTENQYLFSRTYIKNIEEDSEEIDLDIPFKLSDGIYQLAVQSEHLNQPVDINMMSAGTKRIIWLLVHLFAAKYTNISLFVIEEIETSVHPKLLKMLLEIISEISKDVCVILTSHSPLLIQYIKPAYLYIGQSDDLYRTSFAKIKASKEQQVSNAAHKRGMSVGEFIFDIISNDMESESIFDAILEGSDD